MQCIRGAVAHAERADGEGTGAEHGQADSGDVGGVPVQAPDDDAVEPGGLCLQRDEVADAALIGTAAVVDDQHVTGFGSFQGFQEDVHAARVPGRQHPPGHARAGQHLPQR